MWGGECSCTVEPPLKETPIKGQDSEHQNVTSYSANTFITSDERNLSIMNRITCPKSYVIQRFHCTCIVMSVCVCVLVQVSCMPYAMTTATSSGLPPSPSPSPDTPGKLVRVSVFITHVMCFVSSTHWEYE